jgi:signal transduction histidine kinase
LKFYIVIFFLGFCINTNGRNTIKVDNFLEIVQIQAIPNTTGIKTYFNKGISSLKNLEYEKAYRNIDLGLQEAKEIGDEHLIALGNYYLGSYFYQLSDMPQALTYVNKALAGFERLDKKADVAKCYYTLGKIYKNISDYEKALLFSFKSLRINEEIKLEFGTIRSFTLIGAVYLRTGDYLDAELNFKNALKLQEDNNDIKGLISSNRNLGVLNQKRENYEEALKHFHSGLVNIDQLPSNVIDKIDIIDVKAILLGNIGSTLRSQGKYNASLDFLFQSLKIKKELKRNSSTAHTCNDIAETFMQLNNYAKAKEYALEAANLSKNTNVNQEKFAYFLMSKCDYALQNYKGSYDNFKKYNSLKDSVFSVQKAARINEMQIQYETEKRDLKIENQNASIGLLNLQNKNKTQLLIFGSIGFLVLFGGILLYRSFNNTKKRAIAQQEFSQELIKSQEQERTRIAKDLHDGVGQQLTLLKLKAQNDNQTELSGLVGNALEEVRSVSRDLYPVTLTKLGLTLSVEELLLEIDEETDLFVSLEIDNVNDSFNEMESLNFYRFIQESLNNVLKHANAKTLIVNILKQSDGIDVLIKDNGQGFEMSKMIGQNSLGLKTMAERINILKGNLALKSKMEEGTSILVQIPV